MKQVKLRLTKTSRSKKAALSKTVWTGLELVLNWFWTEYERTGMQLVLNRVWTGNENGLPRGQKGLVGLSDFGADFGAQNLSPDDSDDVKPDQGDW